MFLGSYNRSIDDKKRIVIPPKYKEELGSKFFITLTSENNLEIRSKEEFSNFLNKIEENNSLDPLMKKYKRFIFGNTHEVELDKVGRFTFNENHFMGAAIKKEVVFVGMGSKIEIWSKENYENYNKDLNEGETLSNLEKEMFEKGIKL